MPFRSEAQRRYLYANEPEVARRWQKKTKGDLPERVGKCGPIVAKLIDTGDPTPEPAVLTAKLGRHDLIYSLVFDKRAFKKKRAVRVYLRLHDHRIAHVADGGSEWIVRQNPKVQVDDMGERVAVGPGVQAVMGIPDTSRTEPVAKSQQISPLPVMPPIGGASGPSNHTPEMPDFESLYAQPEAQKRQDKEAKQSKDRRTSVWRDLNFKGIHGKVDKPVLRYIDGESSTADVAITQPRHYLTADQLRQHQKRIQEGAAIGYEVVQGQTGKRKKGKV